MSFVPSPQQGDFLHEAWHGTSSIVLIAVAGAGKTTTILQAINGMRGNSIILAFNNRIAKEIDEKLKKMGVDWRKAQAMTMHSAGYRCITKRFGRVITNADKVASITADWAAMHRIDAGLQPHLAVVCKLVSLAKQNGVGIKGCGDIRDASVWEDIVEHFNLFDDEKLEKNADALIELSMEVLEESNGNVTVIDFDDMIYLTLLHDLPMFHRFDNVFVDEAQDTNTVRRLLAERLMSPRGRLFAVGDPRQAIYGFTGADNDSLDLIKKAFRAKEMPLTVTYRCPKAVVEFARNWVDHIEAHPSAPEGTLGFQSFEQMMTQRDLLNGEAAILCRNTRPLVASAFALIRAKIPCRIEGRDIGEQLKKLATKWKSVTSIAELEDRLEDWLEREVERWTERKKLVRVQEAQDKVETLKVIIDACREEKRYEISAVVSYIDMIFADNVAGILTLSTIHKSKGREWKRVFWLDRTNTCPSKYATQPWEREQEVNIMYVAATRSMSELIELTPPLPKKKAANDNAKAEEKAA